MTLSSSTQHRPKNATDRGGDRPGSGDPQGEFPLSFRSGAWLLLSIVVAIFYFSWLLRPERVGVPLLFGLLLVADGLNLFQAATFWLTVTWRRVTRSTDDTTPVAAPVTGMVDILIPTYNEPPEIVEPTLRGALALARTRPGVEIYLLDDGGRPVMRSLAERCGVNYIARPIHEGAKAGNINYALRRTNGDFVVVFDCDHVPRPRFLDATLPYFADETVALVQTPQSYRNADTNSVAAAAAEQQALFFGPICEGRDAWRSTFCCGTNLVMRREMLEAVGGFDEDSITEDLTTTVRLHARGWQTRYVSEVLADGLGPEDIESYVSQQYRWARGCLGLLFSRDLWRSDLSRTLRWQYVAGCVHFLSGWTVFFYALLPVLFLVGGWLPIRLDQADEFVLRFMPYYLVSLFYVSFVSQRLYGPRGLFFTMGSFAIHIRATISVVLRRKMTFAVTPKQAVEGLHLRVFWPNLGMIALLLGASGYAVRDGVEPATVNAIAFALVNAVVVGSVLVVARLAPSPANQPGSQPELREPVESREHPPIDDGATQRIPTPHA